MLSLSRKILWNGWRGSWSEVFREDWLYAHRQLLPQIPPSMCLQRLVHVASHWRRRVWEQDWIRLAWDEEMSSMQNWRGPDWCLNRQGQFRVQHGVAALTFVLITEEIGGGVGSRVDVRSSVWVKLKNNFTHEKSTTNESENLRRNTWIFSVYICPCQYLHSSQFLGL